MQLPGEANQDSHKPWSKRKSTLRFLAAGLSAFMLTLSSAAFANWERHHVSSCVQNGNSYTCPWNSSQTFNPKTVTGVWLDTWNYGSAANGDYGNGASTIGRLCYTWSNGWGAICDPYLGTVPLIPGYLDSPGHKVVGFYGVSVNIWNTHPSEYLFIQVLTSQSMNTDFNGFLVD